jgi:TRAP-type mannitol/chloroaromatic compound transport system permease small subunit
MAVEADLDAPAPAARHPLDLPAQALASIGTVWIFLIMCLVVADVIGRDFLDKPITGVAEFSARSVASIVFLQLAAAVCSGRMTRSDFLLNLIGRRSPAAVKVLDVMNALVGAALFAALTAIALPEFRNSWASNEFYGVQGVYSVPAWPFRGLIIAGSVAAAVCYLLTIPGILRRHGQTGPVDDPLGGGA